MTDDRSTRGKRVPTSLAALALDVREGTIRQWARRGKLTRYGTRRQALYDLNELAALVVGEAAAAQAGGASNRAGTARDDGDMADVAVTAVTANGA